MFIVALIVFSQAAFAQYKSVALGVKVAPGFGWLKTDAQGYDNNGIVPGIAWGFVSEFYFAENYALSTGFNFDFQNGKLSYPESRDGLGSGELTRKYRLKYLEIPAVIKMRTNEIKGLRFFGQVGLGLGIRLSSKGKDEFISDNHTTQTTEFSLIDSQTRLFKAAMIVGVGVEYPFDNSTALVAGINFNNGFTNALKGTNTVNSSVDHHGVPNFIELSMAIMF